MCDVQVKITVEWKNTKKLNPSGEKLFSRDYNTKVTKPFLDCDVTKI